MTVRVAINGFGRIGRLVLRALLARKDKNIKVVAINDLGSIDANAYLLRYDSIHGALTEEVTVTGDTLDAGMGPIKVIACPKPADLPWAELKIDIVYECSGRFTTRELAAQHLAAGAKRVLVSAPTDGADLTVVYGVNHDQIKASHTVLSNASCTTNCLAPVVHVLDQVVGIERGYMTTIHAYTGDQSLVDTYHKDLRRARASTLSMIPTSTGAAKAVGLVLPHMKGKLDGTAIRVPTANVSLIDFKFTTAKPVTVDMLNQAVMKASKGPLKGILAVNEAPLVSIDFNHNPHSSIFDITQTQVLEGVFCRVLSWYDNEWGFSNRMLDTTHAIANTL